MAASMISHSRKMGVTCVMSYAFWLAPPVMRPDPKTPPPFGAAMGFMGVVAPSQALELSLAAIAAVLDSVLWCFRSRRGG
jgi:hypothetical protein